MRTEFWLGWVWSSCRTTEKPGFQALAEVAGIQLSAISATDVAFGMAPRINAAGRLEHAEGAVRLLTAPNGEAAAAAALTLDRLNKERQLHCRGHSWSKLNSSGWTNAK